MNQKKRERIGGRSEIAGGGEESVAVRSEMQVDEARKERTEGRSERKGEAKK